MTKYHAIYVDVRANGFGVVYKDRAEVWQTDLESCLQQLRPLLEDLTHSTAVERRQTSKLTFPAGFPQKHVKVDHLGSFGVHMGYTDCDGFAAFGMISAIWPQSVDEALAAIRLLLQAQSGDETAKEELSRRVPLVAW